MIRRFLARLFRRRKPLPGNWTPMQAKLLSVHMANARGRSLLDG